MTQMYTIQDLKKRFSTFKTAKDYFKVKAQSWQKLCDKLNVESNKDTRLVELEFLVRELTTQLESLRANKPTKNELDILLMDLVYKRGVGGNEIFESREVMEGEPEDADKDDWSSFYSTLKRRYHRLSQIYHPDRNGTKEQMGNLTHAYESALIYVKANNGMDL
jgi:hypothetical protein